LPTYGLGSFWRKVEDALEDLIPVYDKINKIISLDQDLRLRRLAVAKVIRGKGIVVLDAGCGPGTMSKLILRSTSCVKQIVLLDPLKEMLKQSKRQLDASRCAFVQAVFEYLPFRSSVFDAVVSTFALRDAFDLSVAVTELGRVVKGFGGVVLILDLGKPNSKVLQAIVGVYWRILVPLLASACIGKGGLVYRLLYYTYVKLPTNAQLKKMLQGSFTYIDLEERMLGGVILIRATK
jgi:demethylmenaquinone methyltransferase/2-methoxy-6-polyprenyl-1,4-benzoquinol methylase